MRILLFAHLRDVVGCSEIELPEEQPLGLEEFWSRLLADHPALEPYLATIRVARNQSYLEPGEPLDPGDEIALIPPVSGG